MYFIGWCYSISVFLGFFAVNSGSIWWKNSREQVEGERVSADHKMNTFPFFVALSKIKKIRLPSDLFSTKCPKQNQEN